MPTLTSLSFNTGVSDSINGQVLTSGSGLAKDESVQIALSCADPTFSNGISCWVTDVTFAEPGQRGRFPVFSSTDNQTGNTLVYTLSTVSDLTYNTITATLTAQPPRCANGNAYGTWTITVSNAALTGSNVTEGDTYDRVTISPTTYTITTYVSCFNTPYNNYDCPAEQQRLYVLGIV